MKRIDAATEQMVKDYVFARDAETQWKKRKEAVRDALLEAFGDVADGDLIVDSMEENVLLTVKVIDSYRLDQGKVKAEHPDVYAKCTKSTSQTRLETPK